MSDDINPLATHYLPAFISGPGQSDSLLIGIGIFLLVLVFLVGIAFLWLHSLPERLARKGQKLQFELVAVLCMAALFTHNNLLWGIALILALIDFPDITSPLKRMSDALERLSGLGVPAADAATPDDGPVDAATVEAAATQPTVKAEH